MGRGIVVTGRSFIGEGTIDLSGGIKEIDLRRYLTYFDKIVYADSTHFGGIDSGGLKKYSGNTKDLKSIIDRDILLERRVDIPTSSDDEVHMKGQLPSTFEGFQVMRKTRPIAQLEVFRELNASDRENIWVLGQTGKQLVLPESGTTTPTLDITLKNSLPVPIDCDMEEIIKLKESNPEPFYMFRETIDGFTTRISKAENTQSEAIMVKEEIEKNLITIKRIMKERKIKNIFGTIKASIDLGKDYSKSVLPAIGALSSGDPLSVMGVLGALAGLGANAIVDYQLNKGFLLDELEPNLKPYLYLYKIDELNN